MLFFSPLETPLKPLEPDLQGSIQKQLPFIQKIPRMQDGKDNNNILFFHFYTCIFIFMYLYGSNDVFELTVIHVCT